MRVIAQNYVGYFIDGDPIPFSRIKWMDLAGKPYIWHVVERLKRCKKIDEIILATQGTSENKDVVSLAQEWNLNLRYLGKPHNWDSTLKWYESLDADIVIYIDGISPLIDPDVLDSAIDYFIGKDSDYLTSEDTLSFFISKTKIWPKLYELEKDFDEIKRSWSNLIRERYDFFKSDIFGKLDEVKFLGQNQQKWYPLLRKIYDKFYKPGEIISLDEVLSFYKQDPDWFEFLPESNLEVEITNDCDLKCIMCPRTSKMSREVGYMDFELFKKIIDETEASSIHFSRLGEPLLHPQIKEMFAYAKDKGLEVGLWTNGLSLDEGFSKQIIEREFVDYIIFGLDAATKETYSKVKGVDLFDKAVENINRFLKLKKERVTGMEKDTHGWWGQVKPIIGVQILKMKENDAEIEQFMDKWDYMDKTKKMINYKNRSQELNKIEDEQERSQASQKLNKELWETFYTKIELPVEYAIIGHFNNYCGQIEDRSVIDVTPLKRFSCKQLSSPTILWNGDALLCRHDLNGEHLLGNLKEQDMKSINNKIEEVWQAHRDGRYNKFPLCANCKEWYYNLYA